MDQYLDIEMEVTLVRTNQISNAVLIVGDAISIAYNPANVTERIFSKLKPIIAIWGNIGDSNIRIITPNPIILGWARKKPKNFCSTDFSTFSS